MLLPQIMMMMMMNELMILSSWWRSWQVPRWKGLPLHSPWPHKLPFLQCHQDLTFYSSEHLFLPAPLFWGLLPRLLLAPFIRTNHCQYLLRFEIFLHHPLQTGLTLLEQKQGLRDAPCLVLQATVHLETNCPLSPLAAQGTHGCLGQSLKYQ